MVRRGAKLLHAFGECTVPRVTLVTRKIYGGAYIAMNSRSLGATKVFAWPDAEVAVMGAKAAVGILHKKKLAAAPDARARSAARRAGRRAREDRRRRGQRHRDRCRRREDRPGPHPQQAHRGAGRGAGTPRPAQEHPAVITSYRETSYREQTQNRTARSSRVRFCVCSSELSPAVTSQYEDAPRMLLAVHTDALALLEKLGGFATTAQLLTVMTRQQLDVQVRNRGLVRVWYGVLRGRAAESVGTSGSTRHLHGATCGCLHGHSRNPVRV